jgi:hypothetical protein
VHRAGGKLVTAEVLEIDEPQADNLYPSVRDNPDLAGEAEEHLIRTDRYTYAGALGAELIERQLIFDHDAPSEELSVRLRYTEQSEHPNPYIAFAENLAAGFRASAAEFAEAQPDKDAWLRFCYDSLLSQDESRHLTRNPVSSRSIQSGNEGPYEAAGLTAFVQLLAETQGNKLDTAEKRLMAAHSVVSTNEKERFAWGIMTFLNNRFWYSPPSFNRPDLATFDHTQSTLVDRSDTLPQTPYTIDFGDQIAPHEASPLLHMKCPLHYLSPEGYRLSYLELYMHAAINTAYDEGLLKPGEVPEH